MAMSKGTKTALTVGGIALGVFGLIGAANAADGGDDDGGGDDAPPDCGPGRVPFLRPDGTWECQEIVIVDPPDLGGDDDDPLPPPPPNCNYSGCGPQFDSVHSSPSFYALRVQQLGYPINVAGIAANGSFIAVNPARGIIREFQRDYNAIRSSNGLAAQAALRAAQGGQTALASIKNAPPLSEDGLIGNNTAAGIARAHTLVAALNLSWENCVNLSGA